MIGSWPAPGGGEEYAVVFDRGRTQRLLVIPALFGEGNSLRHFTVEVMRRLDRAGIDTILPDLPGCNESPAPLSEQTLTGWRGAVAACAGRFRATHALSMRAGALLVPPDLPGWRFAPVEGRSALDTLLRAEVLGARERGETVRRADLLAAGRAEGLRAGGHELGALLVRELADADLPPCRLQDLPQSALGGAGLWLRAEPAHDPGQADQLADIIAAALTP